jgi:hypothetical protein
MSGSVSGETLHAEAVSWPGPSATRSSRTLTNWLVGKFDRIALNSTVRELEEAVRSDPVTPGEVNAQGAKSLNATPSWPATALPSKPAPTQP